MGTAISPSKEFSLGYSEFALQQQRLVPFVQPRRGRLSAEERRQNHIRQEQRRRALVKDGFYHLTVLVPGLKRRDLSKSALLERAAEWLEGLIQANKALRERLRLLETLNRRQRYF